MLTHKLQALTGSQRAVAAAVTITLVILLLPRLRSGTPSPTLIKYDPDFNVFLTRLKVALDQHQLPHRVLSEVLSETNKLANPACGGMWLEFGVHTGGTLRLTANWKSKHCGKDSSPVHGFDTFTGLPEDWDGQYKKGMFDLKGKFPVMPPNVHLWKGLFSKSLPGFISEVDTADASGRAPLISYLHVDCDLYVGASDVLTTLEDRIAPRAVVVFDELINYVAYRDHEVKALWEWLQRSGRTLEVIGVMGPLAGRTDAMELWPKRDLGGFHQSVAFIAQ